MGLRYKKLTAINTDVTNGNFTIRSMIHHRVQVEQCDYTHKAAGYASELGAELLKFDM